MTPQTRFLTLLALATTIAVAALSACGGDDERQVSSELATELQQILDSAVEGPKTVFPGTAIALVITNRDDPSPVLFPALQLMADEAS